MQGCNSSAGGAARQGHNPARDERRAAGRKPAALSVQDPKRILRRVAKYLSAAQCGKSPSGARSGEAAGAGCGRTSVSCFKTPVVTLHFLQR